MTLHVSRGKFSLPDDFATDTYACLGRRDSGKTYNAGVITEEILKVGVQVVVLDPVGKWWALRLARDGKSPGFEIPVFGGPQGDVPLNANAGELVADIVVKDGISLVLDLRDFDDDSSMCRFVTAFAKRLYKLKQAQTAPTPIHLVLEEAEEFLPQNVQKHETKMVHAFKRLIKLGRNYGIGAALVSQRSAGVNKQALSQIGTLIALQTTSPHDRKAIREWFHGVGYPDVDDELPSLGVGEAIVCSPRLKIVERVKFREKETYNSSATPKLSKRKKAGPRVLALPTGRLDEIAASMASVIEEARASDPKALQREIKALQKRIRELEAANAQVEVQIQIPDTTEIQKLLREMSASVAYVRTSLETSADQLANLDSLRIETEAAADKLTGDYAGTRAARRNGAAPKPNGARRVSGAAGPAGHAAGRERLSALPPWAKDAPDVKLKAGARKMLRALAASDKTLSRAELGTLSGFKPSGGTFRDYLSVLKRNGLVVVESDSVSITTDGRAVAGPVETVSTTEEILALWMPRLKKGCRDMLQILVDAHPSSLSREELGAQAGFTPGGGTFRDYLSVLKRNGLADVDGSNVTASESLFP